MARDKRSIRSCLKTSRNGYEILMGEILILLECRLHVIWQLGYYGFFMIRAGYARGLNPGGIHTPYLILGAPS